MRVLVVDPHEIARRGIERVLSVAGDLVLVGEAPTAAEALRGAGVLCPDVVLVAHRLPDATGAELCRALAAVVPWAPCIVLTACDAVAAESVADVPDAVAVLSKGVPAVRLVAALRDAAAGRPVDTGGDRAPEPRIDDAARLRTLDDHQRRLLAGIAAGLTNREIALRGAIAEKTVKNQVTQLLRKLGVTSRTQAAVVAVRGR